MGRYKLVVLSNPVPGREDEYNDWYSGEHLKDIVSIPGFASAQRMKLVQPLIGEYAHKYLAIYEIDAENAETALKALTDVAGSGSMFLSESLDLGNILGAVFEACSDEVSAPKETATG